MRKKVSQDSWTMRKRKTRISWVWKMRNDHYGVRKKAIKHGKWGMKQDSVAWKFRTQKSDGIIYSNFEEKFRALPRFHCIHIIYLSKLGKSRVQRFKRCANRSWNEEVIAIWRQLHQARGSFRNDLEIQLMNSKSTSKWHQFWIHPLPLWCFTSFTSGIASRALHPP